MNIPFNTENILPLNGRVVAFHGVHYRIIAQRLGKKLLADAEPIGGGERIVLNDSKSKIAVEFRQRLKIEAGACAA